MVPGLSQGLTLELFAHLSIVLLAAVLIGSGVVSAVLIRLLHPLLVHYALARPNGRSSHKVPTPQGGGIAVVGAGLMAAGLCLVPLGSTGGFLPVAVAAIVLGIVGAVDDIRPLSPAIRLVLQILAVSAIVAVSRVRILPDAIPAPLEQAILVLAGVWFVNLVNFMDGLDWITVAEMVPITAFLVVALFGRGLFEPAFVAAGLCGALLGFAPFNKPVARLFLGDVGSLPIGLLVGWMLLSLAGSGALVSALLLPLYYLMDATITLVRRLARRERVWEAHRSHFYQRATDNGFTAMSVSLHVLGLNLVLAGLAGIALAWPFWLIQACALATGLVLVTVLLNRFSTPRQGSP